jgi:TetR/AcrR family transcriptional regulator, lmrAB and yxaGH operons repressor
MPQSKVTDQELYARLIQVFREYGFEGASLTRLSQATGLERASLYHRFPGGKEEMARAVQDHVAEVFHNNILAPLNEAGPLRQKVSEVGKRIRAFYEEGKQSCLLDTLSLAGGGKELQAGLAETYRSWIGAFAEAARQAGYSPAQARKRAEDAVIQIHGSLVMARVTGEKSAFRRVIDQLPNLLLGEAAQ